MVTARAAPRSSTREEIADTPDPEKRARLQRLLEAFAVFPMTDEMRELADLYVRAGVFTPVMLDDALHVAAAVLTRPDVLLSWKFRHLVNRRGRAKVNEVNISLGLPTIEILPPSRLPSFDEEIPMRYFDYENVALDAGIAAGVLEELGRVIRREFPYDDMMYELHLLRACRAIRDGRLTLNDALGSEQPAGA